MPYKPIPGGAAAPPADAIAPAKVKFTKDKTRRNAIRRFDKRAAERQSRVRNSQKRQGVEWPRQEVLRECEAQSNSCANADDACGVCEFHARRTSKRCRRHFEVLARERPRLAWRLQVAVPAEWQQAPGCLMRCRPAASLEAVAQRVRRAGEGVTAIIGLDVTLNTAKGTEGACRYWSPHVNILTPLADAAVVKKALVSICPRVPLVPKPFKRRKVVDPFVGANYALKFDLNAVRGREQRRGPRETYFRLMPWKSRLSNEDFDEFVRWRSTFPMSDLMKVVGIGTSKGGWRLLKK